MTDDTNTLERLIGESSRRTFMKGSALASGGLALSLSGFGGVAAQDGDATRGVMLNSQFSAGARFTVASDALGWAPVQTDAQGNQLDTRVINYRYSQGAYAMLFVPQNANLQEGQTYEFGTGTQGFDVDVDGLDEDLVFDDEAELGLVGVQFTPVQQATTQGGNQTAGNQTATNQTAGDDGT
ncbi:twin-arginine translocation signal domain-containing protein [Halorussus salinisoli]|uniref:twin-arginine translocation signal domain-containing protein n=1 Tax=Halorussus salinisoli TaxID=2558242 RepID=UPI0010C1F0F7|nr:twin-arginine translocation signal domain-containing protein [Halorussus salinisoli]